MWVRDLAELGMFSLVDEGNLPEPTDRQIAAVEEVVGAKLPGAYVDFLMFSNGGYPRANRFDFEANGQRASWEINDFFHISSDPNSPGDVLWHYRYRWPD